MLSILDSLLMCANSGQGWISSLTDNVTLILWAFATIWVAVVASYFCDSDIFAWLLACILATSFYMLADALHGMSIVNFPVLPKFDLYTGILAAGLFAFCRIARRLSPTGKIDPAQDPKTFEAEMYWEIQKIYEENTKHGAACPEKYILWRKRGLGPNEIPKSWYLKP